MTTGPLTADDADRVLADSGLRAVCTLEEGSEALGVSKSTLRRRVESGELRRIKTRDGRGGRLLVLRRDLAALLARMAT